MAESVSAQLDYKRIKDIVKKTRPEYNQVIAEIFKKPHAQYSQERQVAAEVSEDAIRCGMYFDYNLIMLEKK